MSEIKSMSDVYNHPDYWRSREMKKLYGEVQVVFDTEKDAKEAVKKMHDMIDDVGKITVKDLLDIAGYTTSSKDDEYYWDNLTGLDIVTTVGERRAIKMPSPKAKIYEDDLRYAYRDTDNIATLYPDIKKSSIIMVDATNIPNIAVNEDMVNHPKHYKTANGLETIDVIEAFTDGLNGVEATDTGNIIKYACRWKKKNGIEDLKKIRWYVDHLIAYLEKNARK